MNKQLKQIEPIHKTLVIGIGGTGKEVLIQLKRRLLCAGYADTLDQPYFKLLALDFDPKPVSTITQINSNSQKVELNPDEFVLLNTQNIKHRLNNLQEKRNIPYFKDWYPDMVNNFMRMGTAQSGAAQWRPLGRLGYFEHAEIFQKNIEKKLDQLMSVTYDSNSRTSSDQVVVYLVCSMAGGTGGGILFDAAYFLRDLQANIRKVGMLLLPGIYSEFDILGRTFANTYAGLKELTAFANQTKSFFAKYPKGRSIKIEAPKNSSPLDLIYLYDKQIGSDIVANDISQIGEIISESIYLDASNKFISQAQESAYTNLTKAMNELSNKCVFNTIGNTTLIIPSIKELKKYWTEKYSIEILGTNLTRKFTSKLSDKIQNINKTNNISIQEDFSEPFHTILNNIIEEDSNEILKNCQQQQWNDNYIQKAGKEFSKIITKERDKEKAWGKIIKWLDEMFIHPKPDFGKAFSFNPKYLPDNLPDNYFLNIKNIPFLRKGIEDFKEKINKEINNLINQDNNEQKADIIKMVSSIDYFFEQQILKLKEKAKKYQDNIKGNLTGEDAQFYKEQKQILIGVYDSRPLEWFNTKNKAFVHWSMKFLNEITESYKNDASYVRVYTLLADAIEDLRKNSFKDLIEYYKQFIEILQQIGQDFNKEDSSKIQFLQNHLKNNNIVVQSAVNEKFLENSWKELKSSLNQEEILENFLQTTILKSLIINDNNKIFRTIRPNEVKDKIYKYAKDKIAKIFKKEEKQLSASFEYYNPYIWLDDSYLAKQIAKAKSNFIFSNTVINRSEYDMVFAVFPEYSPNSDKQEFKKYHTKFTGLIKNAFDGISTHFEAVNISGIDNDKHGEIIIRHISLNHPTYNLTNIGAYYDAYNRYGKHKKLFHIHKDFEKFPEVILESQIEKFPVCGNPDCTYDLTNVARNILECPECHRPIKSRCGNLDCGADNLHERNDIDNNNPPTNCPSCGKFLRTYWWQCEKHQTVISRESKYCRQCLEEYAAGKILFNDVEKAFDVVPYILCPGCINNRKKDPFEINFLDVYNNIPDNLVGKALSVYYNKKTSRGRCPKCNSQLLPICPYFDSYRDEIPHFVQRGAIVDVKGEIIQSNIIDEHGENIQQGHFYCTSDQEHAAKCIKECSYCGMPLKENANNCPRCKRWKSDYKDEFLKFNIEERKNILERKNQIYFGFPDAEKDLRCINEEDKSNSSVKSEKSIKKEILEPHQNVSDQEKMEHFKKGLL